MPHLISVSFRLEVKSIPFIMSTNHVCRFAQWPNGPLGGQGGGVVWKVATWLRIVEHKSRRVYKVEDPAVSTSVWYFVSQVISNVCSHWSHAFFFKKTLERTKFKAVFVCVSVHNLSHLTLLLMLCLACSSSPHVPLSLTGTCPFVNILCGPWWITNNGWPPDPYQYCMRFQSSEN